MPTPQAPAPWPWTINQTVYGFIGALVLSTAGATVVANHVSRSTCEARWANSGMSAHWTYWTKCMVSTPTGDVPEESVKIMVAK